MSTLDDAIREHLELMRRRGADAAEVARAEREALGIRSPEEEAREAAEAAGIIPAQPPREPDVAAPHAPEPRAAAHEPAPYVEEPDFGRDADAVLPPDPTPAIEHSHDAPVGEIVHDAHAPVARDPEPEAEAPPAEHHAIEPADDPEVAERAAQSTVAFSADDVAAATAAHDAEALSPASPEPPRPAPPVHADEDYVYERDPEPREEAAAPPAAPDPEATREHAAPPPAEQAEPEAGEAEDVLEETPDFLQETPEHDRLWFEQRPPRDFDF